MYMNIYIYAHVELTFGGKWPVKAKRESIIHGGDYTTKD